VSGKAGKGFLKKQFCMQKEINYIRHSEIDKKKWDNCIDNALNSIIYPYAWYLDITAKTWDALVLGDYEAVMPLPWRKKFGITYIFQPFYSQQLGIYFCKKNVDFDAFLQAIPKKFKHGSINLNEQNNVQTLVFKENRNYKLDISNDYAEIAKSYNRNCKRNLKKAENSGFVLAKNLSPKEFVSFIQQNLEEKINGVGTSVFNLLESLVHSALENSKGKLVGLADSNNDLHAAGFFLYSKNRLIFSVCASTPFGKENQAMYKLVDSQIKEHCTQFEWFDFSGSNIEGIAYFNSTFGAKPSIYKTILKSKFPFGMRRFKK
jgi:hypothetical protein